MTNLEKLTVEAYQAWLRQQESKSKHAFDVFEDGFQAGYMVGHVDGCKMTIKDYEGAKGDEDNGTINRKD